MQHGRRRIRIVRTREPLSRRLTAEIVLVEIPGQWAHSVVSLIQASQEHRHGGLMVTNVGPGSHGARAGMARGDVLLRYDGLELDSVTTLRRLTEAHHASTKKLIRIEAARGPEDLVFEVLGGSLGITVSPLLHRSVISTSRPRRVPGRFSRTAAQAPNVMPPVIHSLEQARRHRYGTSGVGRCGGRAGEASSACLARGRTRFTVAKKVCPIAACGGTGVLSGRSLQGPVLDTGSRILRNLGRAACCKTEYRRLAAGHSMLNRPKRR